MLTISDALKLGFQRSRQPHIHFDCEFICHLSAFVVQCPPSSSLEDTMRISNRTCERFSVGLIIALVFGFVFTITIFPLPILSILGK